MKERVDFHWRTNLMTLLTFVAPLAAIGLVCGGLENAWDYCVVGNSCTNAWRLHAPALLLLEYHKNQQCHQICPPVTGAITVPWGTPDTTGERVENTLVPCLSPSTATACCWCSADRKTESHTPTLPNTLADLNLCCTTPVSHLSYPFAKSR